MRIPIPTSQLWDNLSERVGAWAQGPVKYLRSKKERALYRLFSIPAFELSVRVVRKSIADDVTLMAAGVSYYAILSLIPMITGLIVLFSVVLEASTVRAALLEFFQTHLPGSTGVVESNIEAVGRGRGFLGVLSILGLFWAASSIFGAMSRAINRAWGVHRGRPFYLARLRHLGITISVGSLFLLSVGTTTILEVLGRVDLPGVGPLNFVEQDSFSTLARPVPFLFTLSIFLLIYRLIPNTYIRWRHVWPGALLAAITFEISKSVFVFYLEHFVNYQKVQDSLSSVVALLVWTYISSLIVIVGAELSSEYRRTQETAAQVSRAGPRGLEDGDLEDEDELW